MELDGVDCGDRDIDASRHTIIDTVNSVLQFSDGRFQFAFSDELKGN